MFQFVILITHSGSLDQHDLASRIPSGPGETSMKSFAAGFVLPVPVSNVSRLGLKNPNGGRKFRNWELPQKMQKHMRQYIIIHVIVGYSNFEISSK